MTYVGREREKAELYQFYCYEYRISNFVYSICKTNITPTEAGSN